MLLLPATLSAAVKWEKTTQQFTIAPRQTEVRTSFPFKNTGREAVTIASIRASCVCCTAAHATEKTVPPGGKSEIVTRVDLHGKTLPLVKTLTVTLSDGTQHVLTVEMAAATK